MNKHHRGVPIDETLEILASADCRRVVRDLLEEGNHSVERNELAKQMASDMDGDVDSTELRLAHQQLPKLAEAGVIEYDHRSGWIRVSEAITDYEPLLKQIAEWENSPENTPSR